MTLSIERVRELLGPDADGKTDEQIQRLAEDLGNAAGAFYDEIQAAWKRDPEGVRWLIHAAQTGEHEDEERPGEFEDDPGWGDSQGSVQ